MKKFFRVGMAVLLGAGATLCGAALLIAQLVVLKDECRARAHDPYYTPFDISFWLNPYVSRGERAEVELSFSECVSWLAIR